MTTQARDLATQTARVQCEARDQTASRCGCEARSFGPMDGADGPASRRGAGPGTPARSAHFTVFPPDVAAAVLTVLISLWQYVKLKLIQPHSNECAALFLHSRASDCYGRRLFPFCLDSNKEEYDLRQRYIYKPHPPLEQRRVSSTSSTLSFSPSLALCLPRSFNFFFLTLFFPPR